MKLKPAWIVGILCGLLFIFLLGIRLGFFETPPGAAVQRISGEETWMNILQQDQKIGYSHRRLVPRNNGYELSESTYMRINTLGLVQDIHIRTKGNLHPDFSLESFAFELTSSLFHFEAHGKVEGQKLTVHIGRQKAEFPLEQGLYLSGEALRAAWASGLKPNQTGTFFVFDPATMGQRPVRVTMLGAETLEVMGQKQQAQKVSVDFMGASETAWIAADGSVVQEEGLLGIKIKKVTQDEALRGLATAASQDLTEVVSVLPSAPIDQAEALAWLRLKISGINDRISLAGGRQTFINGVLTIRKENLSARSRFSVSGKEEFLSPTPFIQSDHPKIKEKVSDVLSPGDPPLIKARKLMAWIHDHIEKRPVLSVPNALETLEKRMGDCNEHAVLLAALARAAGIPAQVEAGLVYMRGRFYYHAWNSLYLGAWITADSVMGQMPADVTHIRLVRGEPREQIDLIGVIGKIKLDILEQSK